MTLASHRTGGHRVQEAKTGNRRETVEKVKRVKVRAKKPAAELFEGAGPLAEEVPVRVCIEFTPEQFARREVLLEKLQKLNVPW